MQDEEEDLQIVDERVLRPEVVPELRVPLPTVPAPQLHPAAIGDERRSLVELQARLEQADTTLKTAREQVQRRLMVVRLRLQALSEYEKAVMPSGEDGEPIPF